MNFALVSEKSRGMIRLPDGRAAGVVFERNVAEALERALAGCVDKPLMAIVFMPADEFPLFNEAFSKYDYRDLLYKAVLFDTEGSAPVLGDEELGRVYDLRTSDISEKELDFLLRRGFSLLRELYEYRLGRDEYLLQLLDTKRDQEDLINIGKSLSVEKDPSKLLRLILFLSKKITGADAGSIYLIEENEKGEKQLRFKFSHTFSKDIPIEEFVMPMNMKSIAGYVAITGKVLNLEDMYRLPENSSYSFNTSIDKLHHYRSKTMLAVPMRNHLDEIIGVIQLLNSKEDMRGNREITGNEAFEIRLEKPEDFETRVVRFDPRYEGLMEAVASQAAIAIENNRMIKQIETQFEEFVKASVNAIESRDKATSGHSFRVAEICKEMAVSINQEDQGVYRDTQFSPTAIKELEYAALLHDFGKVYIDLAIFMKGKKLFPKDFETLMMKMNYLYRIIELQYILCENNLLDDTGSKEIRTQVEGYRMDREQKLASVKKIKDTVRSLNEPTVTDRDPDEILESIIGEIRQVNCDDIEGNRVEVIDPPTRTNLAIKRGSLNEEERKEIESHVIHTYNFVSKIPWPPEFKNIPEIALKHHEKLDGTGYPYGLKKEEIPIQARMMAIADIYDALTASDRPYKKALPKEVALKILNDEAKNNKIDADLLDVFIRHRIYDKVDKDSFRIAE